MIAEAPPLLSRTAESLFWMGRYIERAENVARFIGVNLHLQLDLLLEPAHQWQPLIDTSGDAEVFKERFGDATEEGVLEFLIFDSENPNSVHSCIRAARENARTMRETISSEMWEQMNRMYLQTQMFISKSESGWLSERLRDIRLACHMFRGITEATMSHNEAWQFVRLGGMLERADKTSRLLDVKYFMLLPSPSAVGTPYDDLHWAAVLNSVSGFEMYRKKHGRILPANIVRFLVLDPEFPRAIRHCLHEADEALHAVTGTPAGAYTYHSERLLGMLRAELDFTSADQMIRSGLHEHLDALQARMNAIGDKLSEDFFGRRPATPSAEAGAAL